MENQINEHILKITGSAMLPEPLEFENDYSLGVNVSVVKISDVSKNDGTKDKEYTGRLITCEILKDNGTVMKTEVGSSQSKKLRNQIYAWGLDNHSDIESEELYETIMNGIRANGDAIFNRIMEKR